jgi:hypothetical protein
MSNEGGRSSMQPTKKHPKITLGVISSFFGSKTLYKKQDEVQFFFSVLLIANG